MHYGPYPVYVIGTEWQGEIPVGWQSLALGRMFRRVKRTGYAEEELLSVYRDHGVVLKASRDDNFNSASEDLSQYQLVRRDDLAVNKMKAWQGSIAVSGHQGIVSPAYFVYEQLPQAAKRICSRYLHYLLRSPLYIAQYLRRSKGIRVNQWDLDPDGLKQLEVLLPSVSEQRRIAAFLDYETAKIDALIEKQQQLIDLLKEKRQAVISHAVTKGLNPEAPMRDSGVEWLGEVPVHWDVSRLKFLVSHVVDCHHSTPKYDPDAAFPALRTADVSPGCLDLEGANRVHADEYQARIARLKPEEGDIIYSREGERWGMAALIPKNVDLCLAQRVMLFRAIPEVDSRFLMWALNSNGVYNQLACDIVGATSPHVNIGDIREVWLAVPPIAEQNAIALHVQKALQALDRLDAAASGVIATLQERRTALISAAVTGKIDVRGWRPPEAASEAASA